MRPILGLLGIIAGFLVIWKSEWILQNFGRVDWAEQHLGVEGGSRIFYKLVGLVVIIVSTMYLTGLLEGVIVAIFAPLSGGRDR